MPLELDWDKVEFEEELNGAGRTRAVWCGEVVFGGGVLEDGPVLIKTLIFAEETRRRFRGKALIDHQTRWNTCTMICCHVEVK